jgi:predicted metal-binding protein
MQIIRETFTWNTKMNDQDKRTLIEMVTPQIAAFSPGDCVECEQLFDANIWDSLSKGATRAMGVYIAQLVDDKALPLERCKDLNGKRHNQYRRI